MTPTEADQQQTREFESVQASALDDPMKKAPERGPVFDESGVGRGSPCADKGTSTPDEPGPESAPATEPTESVPGLPSEEPPSGWEASDGKWYPPEEHPDYRDPRPPPPQPGAERKSLLEETEPGLFVQRTTTSPTPTSNPKPATDRPSSTSYQPRPKTSAGVMFLVAVVVAIIVAGAGYGIWYEATESDREYDRQVDELTERLMDVVED